VWEFILFRVGIHFVSMDEALYLVRVIKRDVYDKLLAQPPHERVLTSTKGYAPEVEFPGVCTTLITKNTLDCAYQQLYPGDVVLFLSRRLLEQRNYHLNIDDNWGCISEWNTVYPWQLTRFLKRNGLAKAMREFEDHMGNEVVFHDLIPWSMVCYSRPRIVLANPDTWPSWPLFTAAQPDMCKQPFFLHSLIDITEASLQHLKAVAALVNPEVADSCEFRHLLHNYIQGSPSWFNTSRDWQRLDAFKARLPPMPRTFRKPHARYNVRHD